MFRIGITTVLPHHTVLCHNKKSHKCHDKELQGGDMSGNRPLCVIIDDETREVRQDGRLGNGQNMTTLYTLPPPTTPSLQPVSKGRPNRDQLNILPSC